MQQTIVPITQIIYPHRLSTMQKRLESCYNKSNLKLKHISTFPIAIINYLLNT